MKMDNLPTLMHFAGFGIDWLDYPDSPELTDENEDEWDSLDHRDGLDKVWNDLQELEWVFKVEDAGGAQKYFIAFVDIYAMREAKLDLARAQAEIIRICNKHGLVLEG